MKFQLKALAVAVLASVSGLASASINLGNTTDGSGELFLMAYDTTSQQTYSFDTGLSMAGFAPATGAAQNFSLTSFSDFLSTSTASTVRWGVYARDGVVPYTIYTTAVAGAATTNPTLTKLGNASGAMQSFINATAPLGTHSTTANGYAIQTAAPASGTDFTYGGNILGANGNFSSNLAFNTTGALGDTMNFVLFSNANAGTSTRTAFAYQWKLDAATSSLTYTAPVPEPGTYALMFAGLMAIGAVVRRRTK